jgi:hypothetical protein
MNGMLTPPNAVAAADAFNSVRREIVILFLPTTSLFAFVRRKGPCRLVIMSRQSGQAFSLCDQRPRPSARPGRGRRRTAFAEREFVGSIARMKPPAAKTGE